MNACGTVFLFRIRKGINVLVATPGRLLDHIEVQCMLFLYIDGQCIAVTVTFLQLKDCLPDRAEVKTILAVVNCLGGFKY